MKYQYGQIYLDFSIFAPPHIGGINGDVQSNLSTLAFKNREQLEDFHSIFMDRVHDSHDEQEF